MLLRRFLCVLALLVLSGCTEVQFASHVAKNAMGTTSSGPAPTQQGTFKVGKPYSVAGKTYYPKESYDHVETGIASWYGPGFQGKRTASGERFDTKELTAAHRTLQMPSLVRVTNLDNGRSVVVRVNDRGPFARGRVIDVSQRAAELLGFIGHGTAKVKLEVLAEESQQIAAMAKRGESTKGVELAANQGRPIDSGSTTTPGVITVASSDGIMHDGPGNLIVGSVAAEALAPVPLHQSSDGRVMPDPVVTHVPVAPTNIYVQAGAFTVPDNANRLAAQLGQIAATSVHQAFIDGKTFYRVRVGPAPTVEAADRLLAQVVAAGQDKAIIIVD
ncbi:MAG: septal ring lytic transglycosylase RlpA family protein [Micavibrio aeruginosavorus]|nr:septal ring lytic transglycosylase RlpA family protein [Micavibrio aeruginosavorus]